MKVRTAVEHDLHAGACQFRRVPEAGAMGARHSLGLVEEMPGADYPTEESLRDFVRHHAWGQGHHASCSCAIGPRERGGVLASDFRVHGTRGLRVVDASVFPRIPGFFIASAVYMIGEKAADVILKEANLT